MSERKSKKKSKNRLIWQKIRFYLIFLLLIELIVYFKLTRICEPWLFWVLCFIPHYIGVIIFLVVTIYWGYHIFINHKRLNGVIPETLHFSTSSLPTENEFGSDRFPIRSHTSMTRIQAETELIEVEQEIEEENVNGRNGESNNSENINNFSQEETEGNQVNSILENVTSSSFSRRPRGISALRIVQSAEYVSEMEVNRGRVRENSISRNQSYSSYFTEQNLVAASRRFILLQRRENSRLRSLREEKRIKKKLYRKQRKQADFFYLLSISFLLLSTSLFILLFCLKMDAEIPVLTIFLFTPLFAYFLFQGVFNVVFWSFILKISPLVLQLAGNFIFSGLIMAFLILLALKLDKFINISYIITAIPVIILEGSIIVYCVYYLVRSCIESKEKLTNGRLRGYSFIPLSLGHTKRDELYCKRLKVRGRLDSIVCLIIQIPIVTFAVLLFYHLQSGFLYSSILAFHYLIIFISLFLTMIFVVLYFFFRNKLVKKIVRSRRIATTYPVTRENILMREESRAQIDIIPDESLNRFIQILHNIFNGHAEPNSSEVLNYIRRVREESYPTTGYSMSRGLSLEEIDRLPLHEYIKKCEDNTCRICLQEYKQSEKVRYLPCFHNFHLECIDTWLQSNKTCPLCKIHVPQSISMTDGQLLES